MPSKQCDTCVKADMCRLLNCFYDVNSKILDLLQGFEFFHAELVCTRYAPSVAVPRSVPPAMPSFNLGDK